MNSPATIPFELLIRRALAIGITSAVIGFVEHQAYGWMPSPLSHWLALRKEEIAAAQNLQYFGLAALGLSGLVAALVALGREPVFSGRLLRQSIGQVLNVGGAFIGLIVGLACSVAVGQGLAAAATGFLLAVFAAVFIGGIPTLSFALLQFPTMAFRAKWAEPYRKHISVGLGVFVFATAAWGLGTDMLANPAVQ